MDSEFVFEPLFFLAKALTLRLIDSFLQKIVVVVRCTTPGLGVRTFPTTQNVPTNHFKTPPLNSPHPSLLSVRSGPSWLLEREANPKRVHHRPSATNARTSHHCCVDDSNL
tara:strand:+ start:260 stop:592 length:333 start_codon:yes stop_codon:yes gene_type:complete